jgi:PAS domain S-box-containing protein
MRSPSRQGVGSRRTRSEAKCLPGDRERAAIHLGPADLRAIFRDSPVSIWVEDFSAVKDRLDNLKRNGVRDLRRHFARHPEEIIALARAVKITSVNEATLRLYEARSQAALRRGLNLVFDKESYDVFREEVIALAEGRTQFSSEVATRTLRGRLRHVWLWLVVPPGSAATLSRAFAFVVDITALKESQKDLAQTEAKFRTIFECAPYAILMIDAGSGIIVESNRRAEGLFGRSPDQIAGMHISELVPEMNWTGHLKCLRDQHAQDGWATGEAIVNREGRERIPVSARSCIVAIQEDLRILMMLRETREIVGTEDARDGVERMARNHLAGTGETEKLSRRECEVVRWIAAGLTSRQIAKKLFLSIKTVETHRARIMDKLGFHRTADIVRFAIRSGLCGDASEKG